MKTNASQTDRLIDKKTVCYLLNRSPASLYRDIQRGEFPAPIKLGHSSRWRMSDVQSIIDSRSRFE